MQFNKKEIKVEAGKKVKISGFELWQFNEQGLVKESKGIYDAEEYERQVKYGVDN